MLVLSRKTNEKIILTDDLTGREITITVVNLKNNQVRLGIDAPDEITIVRSELRDSQTQTARASVTA